MVVYFTFIFASLFFLFLSRTTLCLKSRSISIIISCISASFLIFLSTFRSVGVGTDSHNYVSIFNNIQDFDNVIFYTLAQGEFGFWYLNYIGNFFSDDYFIIFFLISIIIVYSYYSTIFKLSPYKVSSLLVLLLMGPYLFHFNGARQGIAIAIFFVSIQFLIDKSFVRYTICILVGFLFHKSIIICIPLYFLFVKKLDFKQFALFSFLFIICFLMFNEVVSLVSEVDSRYSGYSQKQNSSGGVVTNAFNIILFFWFYVCKKINSIDSKLYDLGFTLFFFGTLINIISLLLQVNPSGFLRFSLYFSQVSVFILPISIYSFKNNKIKFLILLYGATFMTLYFYFTTSTFSNLVPYYFNPLISEYL